MASMPLSSRNCLPTLATWGWPCPAPGVTQGPLQGLRISYQYLTADMVPLAVYATLQGCHLQTITDLPSDFSCSMMSQAAYSSSWLCALSRLSLVLSVNPHSCSVLGCELRSLMVLHGIRFWPFGQKYAHQLEVILLGSGSAPPAPPPSTKMHLLDYRYHLMLPVVTRTPAEHKTREESVRKVRERAIVCGHQMQNHPLFGGFLDSASPLHLLSLSFAYWYLTHKSAECALQKANWSIKVRLTRFFANLQFSQWAGLRNDWP